MKLEKFDLVMTNAIKCTFDKYAIVNRADPTEKGNFDDFEMNIVHNMVECTINYYGQASNDEGVQKIEYVATLDIKAGDEIKIFDEHKKSIMHALAGEGANYITHGEYPLIRKGIV